MADARLKTKSPVERPLSPHLQVYRPLINMVMSIVHRMTGAALYFGTILLAGWLTAAAAGPEAFNWANSAFNSSLGRIVLFGYTWVLMHHMLGGLRHFVWDTGHGYDNATVDRLSWGTLIGSVSLTAIIWLYVLTKTGAHP